MTRVKMDKNVGGYVYILQEREFINSGQPIYKMGRTQQEDFRRFKNYPKGSKMEFYSPCVDCKYAENKIKTVFKEKFKQRTDIGTESFEGDINQMRDIMYKIVEQQRCDSKTAITNVSITQIGHKKYKISLDSMHYVTESAYFNFLIVENIVQIGTCDVGSDKFVEKIMSTKSNVDVQNYEQDEISASDDFAEYIRRLFDCDIIINGRIFGARRSSEMKHFGKIDVDVGSRIIELYEIEGKHYEYESLKAHVPCVLRIDSDDNFYVLNMNNKCVEHNIDLFGHKTVDFRLFDDDTAPWLNMDNYFKYHIALATKRQMLKMCLNYSRFVGIFD